MIHDLLEKAYQEYHRERFKLEDPVSLVHSFHQNADREMVGLLASLLAYGNVSTIMASVRRILTQLGGSPADCVMNLGFVGRFSQFKHRFTTGDDIEILLYWIRSVFISSGTIEKYFTESQITSEPFVMKEKLSSFVKRFSSQELPASLLTKRKKRLRNLKYLIPDPDRGSACKRLNMFLRWMVRNNDGIDLGLWKTISPRDLMLPVDTHILKVLRRLRWTASQQATWKVVEDATLRLRTLLPEDPIRYDFSLCHLSMAGVDLNRYFSTKRKSIEKVA